MSDKSVYLKDYRAPDFKIRKTELYFDLGAEKTMVTAHYEIEKLAASSARVWMDGEDLTLLRIVVNGEVLDETAYEKTSTGIGFSCEQDITVVEVVVQISPTKNLQLQGLYESGGVLATQCEAQGFRRIVYGFDRPDMFSVFDVTCEYDQNKYPVVIVAGDCMERTVLGGGRARVRYVDPIPKPTYLFALVAGYFNTIKDTYKTGDDREITLYVHLPIVNPMKQGEFAMEALKKSMVWDERIFDCVIDMDTYHIVGLNDFNFGAMENKGLNIFNTNVLLATASVATDMDYLNVLSVVGHEYFHNWTGNRVGCQNWFQLSLKEGLTTYREMRFTCDSYCQMARLLYIQKLIDGQFKEDRGPTAHPVIPKSYQRIDNFYTNTIYTKGSEVLRMLEDLIGKNSLDQGIKQYLRRYDGQAVTIHEFIGEIESVSGVDLTQFKIWYDQIGTPHVDVTGTYDHASKRLTITLVQQAGVESRQAKYVPLMMPVKIALWSERGERICVDEVDADETGAFVVNLHQERQEVKIGGIKENPIVSSFLGLSAPVTHSDDLTEAQNAVLIRCETDPYVKYIKAKSSWMDCLKKKGLVGLPDRLTDALGGVLAVWENQPELIDLVFEVPSLRVCQESMKGYRFDDLVGAHSDLLSLIAKTWEPQWRLIYQSVGAVLDGTNYSWDRRDINLRKARTLALKMLVKFDVNRNAIYAESLYHNSDNLTDKLAAIQALLESKDDRVNKLLALFLKEAEGNDVLINKWMYCVAYGHQPDGLNGLLKIFNSAICDHKQPNRVMSWLGGFCDGNYALLHDSSGQGYAVLSEVIQRIDEVNPVTSARMVVPLLQKQYFDESRQAKMVLCLRELRDKVRSENVQEKITSALV